MPPAESVEAEPPVYEAYAQLTKMLLPSSGCLAVYVPDGELAWCSGGFERPDLRDLIDGFRGRSGELEANRGVVRETTAGVVALLAWLSDSRGNLLGYVLIELGQSLSNAAKSMAASMMRPLISCLASQLALERAAVIPPAPSAAVVNAKLRFLLSLSDIDLNASGSIHELLQRCVDELNCLSAVFCIPDQDLTETADSAHPAIRGQLEATRKHLLAWVQLNNRPMVVNRIDTLKTPYKILSCPVVDRESRPIGLIALFRGPDSENFELDDVRLIELLGRQTMALLTERRDPESGLMSRPAFERHLHAHLGDRDFERGMLLCLEINDLKAINESFGLAAGDETVLRVAQLIRRLVGTRRAGCRSAADRFMIYLPEHDREGAERLGAELAEAAQSLAYRAGGHEVPLSLRYRVTPPPPGGKARHWIAQAELAGPQGRENTSGSPYNGSGANADRTGICSER